MGTKWQQRLGSVAAVATSLLGASSTAPLAFASVSPAPLL